MSLFDFPDELLEDIGKRLDEGGDIAALARSSRRLLRIFGDYLYLHDQDQNAAQALVWAATNGRQETLVRAQEAGVKLSAHLHLLSLAVTHGHPSAVKTLLSIQGINHSFLSPDGFTPLGLAIKKDNMEIVNILVDHGIDVNRGVKGSWTAAMLAADQGRFEILKFLLDHGANPSARTENGQSPLSCAFKKRFLEVFELLLQRGAALVPDDDGGWAFLHSAAQGGQTKLVELLLDHGADTSYVSSDGWTALALAAFKDKVETARLLIDRGAEVDLPSVKGKTALMIATYRNFPNMMNLLLDYGASTACSPTYELSPLLISCTKGLRGPVELLLRRGADVNHATTTGWTALMAASSHGCPDIVSILLEAGADVEATNDDGWTALFAATDRNHTKVVRCLLDHGAGRTMGWKNKAGQTPAIRAAHAGAVDLIKQFIYSPSFDPDEMDSQGRSPLFHAAMRGHTEAVDWLLPYGQTANAKDRYGNTPIFAATRNGHDGAVRLLLTLVSANTEDKDILGRTLLETARESGNQSLVHLLKLHMGQTVDGLEEQGQERAAGESVRRFDSGACWCDVCCRCTPFEVESYVCDICDGGRYVVCRDCAQAGFKCQDERHPWEIHVCSRYR